MAGQHAGFIITKSQRRARSYSANGSPLGAVIVGALLVINANKMRLKVSEFAVAKVWANVLDFVTGFWILNVAVGGSYIILQMTVISEWLSLLHLVIGVSAAITGLVGIMFHKIASDALTVAEDSGVEEDE